MFEELKSELLTKRNGRLRPEKIRASKTKTINICPRKYDHQYNRGNYPPPSQPATQGSILHQVVALDYEHKLATGKNMDIQEKLNHVDVLFKEDYEHGNTQYRDLIDDVILIFGGKRIKYYNIL